MIEMQYRDALSNVVEFHELPFCSLFRLSETCAFGNLACIGRFPKACLTRLYPVLTIEEMQLALSSSCRSDAMVVGYEMIERGTLWVVQVVPVGFREFPQCKPTCA